MTHSVFIDGAAGTTGLEIADRLAGRSEFSLITLDEDKRKLEAKKEEERKDKERKEKERAEKERKEKEAKKQQEQKDSKASAEEAKKLEAIRKENMKRIAGLAGASGGPACSSSIELASAHCRLSSTSAIGVDCARRAIRAESWPNSMSCSCSISPDCNGSLGKDSCCAAEGKRRRKSVL